MWGEGGREKQTGQEAGGSRIKYSVRTRYGVQEEKSRCATLSAAA